jgi:uncharacterized protein (TIGR02284 family)
MANDIKETRSILNGLIETCKDGEEGFRTCAEHTKDTELRRTFDKYSLQRSHFVGELQTEVMGLGGEPENSGTTSGALHRGWIDLKAKIVSSDDHAMLEECERGEDSAVHNYRDALTKDLPENIRQLIENQYRQIQLAHNEIRALRDGQKTVSSGYSRL